MKEPLGEMLVAAGVVDEEQLREGLAFQRNRGVRLAEALLALGHLDEAELTRVLARQQGMPFVDLRKGRVAPEVLERVPREFCLEQGLLPVMERDGKLVVAIDDQVKRLVADQLQFLIGGEIACALAAPGALREALERYLGAGSAGVEADAPVAAAGGDGDDAPIVRLVQRMFHEALEQRASDIHVEPQGAGLRLRYRVDGVLKVAGEHPHHLAAPLISRLKVMGQMDIAEKRKPQDGRISIQVGGRDIDVRASILPGNHGETMVLRLLDKGASLIGLPQLGFGEEDHAWFRRLIRRPNGLVLVTGPTGSGKTTTLYAALSELNRPDIKILTAEDPVEYHLAGVNQMQVNTKVGLTFARILKAMLRAAPNVILVGEIRDLETAEVAIQAALTGHLVFSTLHTNDAPSALTRLEDLGVKPFLVSTAVQGILAQRLVRRLCPECKEEREATPAEARLLGLGASERPRLSHPRGCTRCDGAGYRGRVGLFEFLEMDASLREMVFRGEGLVAIRDAATAAGRLRSLSADGVGKVLDGTTSLTELLRVVRRPVSADAEDIA